MSWRDSAGANPCHDRVLARAGLVVAQRLREVVAILAAELRVVRLSGCCRRCRGRPRRPPALAFAARRSGPRQRREPATQQRRASATSDRAACSSSFARRCCAPVARSRRRGRPCPASDSDAAMAFIDGWLRVAALVLLQRPTRYCACWPASFGTLIDLGKRRAPAVDAVAALAHLRPSARPCGVAGARAGACAMPPTRRAANEPPKSAARCRLQCALSWDRVESARNRAILAALRAAGRISALEMLAACPARPSTRRRPAAPACAR